MLIFKSMRGNLSTFLTKVYTDLKPPPPKYVCVLEEMSKIVKDP